MRTSIRRLCAALCCVLPMAYAHAEDMFMLPAPDLAKLQLEDAKAGGAYRYGIQIPVKGFAFDGRELSKSSWSRGKDGVSRFVWNIAAPGARTLDFHFSRLALPEGATLILRGEGEDNLRKITAEALSGGAGYWAPYIAGEKVAIELHVPTALRAQARVELASVTHGYRGLFESAEGMQKSGSCNVDVACPAGAGWTDQIDSVGHYTFSQGGSSYVCTGSLMANTAGTTVPYFLTANHCLSTAAVASTVVVYWNYQSATCRTPGSSASGTPLAKSIASHTQSGASLISTNAASDFALLRLNADVPAASNPYWSGWDASGATPSSAVGIHHPAGHEMRIAVEDQALAISGYSGAAGTSHWRVIDWDQGTTEGGSSGSGLWDQNKRLVGQLHGGSAACGNNLSDYYGRLSVSWAGGGSAATRLRDWLDPNSSGQTSIAGYRSGSTPPPPPPPPPANTLSNGVPVTGLAGAAGAELRYTISVPAGASNLSFAMSGGTGDADLHVRFGSAPTTTTYDCRPYQSGNAETCSFAAPQAGTYHVMVRGFSAFSGVSLTGSFSTGGGGTQPSFFQNTSALNIADNSTIESTIAVSGRSGNASAALQVAVNITHTYKGDLKVDLIAPNGTVYVLHNRSGGSADNIVQTFTVNASAVAANGSWRLRVNDNAAGDTGRLNSWSLQF
jgi:lysyl endopeptidase